MSGDSRQRNPSAKAGGPSRAGRSRQGTGAGTLPVTGDDPPQEPLAYLGRQAIFDTRHRVAAYELLYRSGVTDCARFEDGDQATARVVSNTFMEIGLDTVVGDRTAFINVTRGFILGDCAGLFPRDRVYLEVLESVTLDRLVLDRLRALKDDGHRIVLDDFQYNTDRARLLPLADIVKIEVGGLDEEQIVRLIEPLRAHNVRLLAEKVETHETYDACRSLGFELFQGFYLHRPQVIKGRRLPADRAALLALLARINDPGVQIEELEVIITRDVNLSFRLLRYINSAHFALHTSIESIQHALMLLGTNQVRTWVNLVLLAGIVDKPSYLLTIAMVRARMCQLLAESLGFKDTGSFFTVGLFSALDALMDRPLDQLLADLHLAESLNDALLEHNGPMGEALACVLAYEAAAWDEASFADLGPSDLRRTYLDALRWVEEARSALTGG